MNNGVQHIRLAAMNLLAMREHSEVELRKKLLGRFSDITSINKVIKQLADQQLLSDKRFAEAFIRMRFRQLKGPLLISLELKSKGVESAVIETCLAELDVDWGVAAQKARIKKFGQMQPMDSRDKAKQVRYLQSRGFTSSHLPGAFMTGEEQF